MVVALCCMLVVMAFLGCLLMRIVLVLVRDCGAAAGQSLVGATGLVWFLYRDRLKIPVDEGLGRIRDMETPLWTNCLFSAAPGIVKRVYIYTRYMLQPTRRALRPCDVNAMYFYVRGSI